MPTYAKAIVGAVMACLSALLTSLVGDTGFSELTDGQWVAVVLSTVTAFAAVYGIPNGESSDPDTSTPGPYPGDLMARPTDTTLPGDLDA